MAGDGCRRDYIAVLVDGHLDHDRARCVRLPGDCRISRFRKTDGFTIQHAAGDGGPRRCWLGRWWRWWFTGDIDAGRTSDDARTGARTSGNWSSCIRVRLAQHCRHASSYWRDVAGFRRYLFRDQLGPRYVSNQFLADVNVLLIHLLRLRFLWFLRLILLWRYRHWCDQCRKLQILPVK